MAVLEREFMIILFACIAWAWSCLGIKLADLTRKQRVPNALLPDVITGKYIEAAVSMQILLSLYIILINPIACSYYGHIYLLWVGFLLVCQG